MQVKWNRFLLKSLHKSETTATKPASIHNVHNDLRHTLNTLQNFRSKHSTTAARPTRATAVLRATWRSSRCYGVAVRFYDVVCEVEHSRDNFVECF